MQGIPTWSFSLPRKPTGGPIGEAPQGAARSAGTPRLCLYWLQRTKNFPPPSRFSANTPITRHSPLRRRLASPRTYRPAPQRRGAPRHRHRPRPTVARDNSKGSNALSPAECLEDTEHNGPIIVFHVYTRASAVTTGADAFSTLEVSKAVTAGGRYRSPLVTGLLRRAMPRRRPMRRPMRRGKATPSGNKRLSAW